jgi:hypothetical protein
MKEEGGKSSSEAGPELALLCHVTATYRHGANLGLRLTSKQTLKFFSGPLQADQGAQRFGVLLLDLPVSNANFEVDS